MVSLLLIGVMNTFLIHVSSTIPAGNELKVVKNCKYDQTGTGQAKVTAYSDLILDAKAICSNGVTVPFIKENAATHSVLVDYSSSNISDKCSFNYLSPLYTISVLIGWSPEGSSLIVGEELYKLSCSKDIQFNQNSHEIVIADSILPITHIEQDISVETSHVVDMLIVDVRGVPIVAPVIPLGRQVALRASIHDSNGTGANFRAISCAAVNEYNVSYSILRGGCGDGVILNKYAGFMTYGNIIYSPYFAFFTLYNSEDLEFDCTFSLCENECNGSSCHFNVRRRRSVRERIVNMGMGRPRRFVIRTRNKSMNTSKLVNISKKSILNIDDSEDVTLVNILTKETMVTLILFVTLVFTACCFLISFNIHKIRAIFV